MILTQYYLGCLSHGSYLVGDETTGQAIVVDPRRDIDEYLADAAANHLTIVGVINTHFHADFVAGHLELAAATGAWIGYGARAEAAYEIRHLANGEKISLGEVELEILDTPGHTWESVSVIVREHAGDVVPHAVLTGDTLFIGDVGRPDLAASVGADPEELARALYVSIHEALLALPDPVRVLPAHGAGSACGKNLSDELESTIGDQRRNNASVQPMSEIDFVTMIRSGQPAIPGYFAVDAMINRSDHEIIGATRELAPLTLTDVRASVERGAHVLDTRTPEFFALGHLVGSVNVGLDGRFSETAGMVIKHDDTIVIIAEAGREDEAGMRLARIGFDRVAGYLVDPVQAFSELGAVAQTGARVEVEEFDTLRSSDAATILDVRNPGEVEQGAIPGSLRIPLAELSARHAEIPDGPVLIHCAGGWRSSVAASALRGLGHAEVTDLIGGYNAWAAQHASVGA
ncbi:MBL fold metallo-hydrolase [Cryobacterium sp. Hh11]|uniref:MBL fold metallo-hydrolase n=1 Tax=Cryobacterium sp. Hh11 TaxID=2555868 RepID=UPI00106DC435|nr:MBL fold metallo-hydrolase [Cryobacterium sp. Hh11]TFD52338.1 MBL fold metallo-hydrolase [Cryobacterium sp. Hh11]